MWVGTPSNHAICRMMAAEVSAAGGRLLYGRHVHRAQYESEAGQWSLHATNRLAESSDALEEHGFDALVFSDKLLLLPNPCAMPPS